MCKRLGPVRVRRSKYPLLSVVVVVVLVVVVVRATAVKLDAPGKQT